MAQMQSIERADGRGEWRTGSDLGRIVNYPHAAVPVPNTIFGRPSRGPFAEDNSRPQRLFSARQAMGAACLSSDGVPTKGQPSRQ